VLLFIQLVFVGALGFGAVYNPWPTATPEQIAACREKEAEASGRVSFDDTTIRYAAYADCMRAFGVPK